MPIFRIPEYPTSSTQTDPFVEDADDASQSPPYPQAEQPTNLLILNGLQVLANPIQLFRGTSCSSFVLMWTGA